MEISVQLPTHAEKATPYNVMFNKREGGFYRGIKPRGDRLVTLYPHKTWPAKRLLNDFKNIPGKECLNGVDNNDVFLNVGN